MYAVLNFMKAGKNNPQAKETHKFNSRLFSKMKEVGLKKHSEAMCGRKLSQEQRAKVTAHLKKYRYKKGDNKRRGTKHMPETIEKMRANATGKKWTEETRRKIMEYWNKKRASRPTKPKKPLHNRKPVSQYTLTGELV